MELWRYRLAFLLLGILGSTYAQDFYVAAPSTLRLNAVETAAIAIDGNDGARVHVYIQDYPAKEKNITHVVVEVPPGQPKVFKFRFDVKDFPPNFLTAPGSPKLVSLNARFLNFHKEMVIPLSTQSGYMFIQTDKPIYTPKQRVDFRIISLTEEALPSNELFQLQIRNPANIIVEKKSFNARNMKSNKAFASHMFKFPTYPILGEWSATVRFGFQLEQNTTVHFQLKEYVLPTFTVELKTSSVILPEAEEIEVRVIAQYLYGKKVKGVVSLRLGVKSEQGPEPVYFATFPPKDLDEGEYTLKTHIEALKDHEEIGWFPGIDKSHLVVEATVVDYATGNKEVATDSNCVFSNTPFVISFKRCHSDFKPGLPSIFEADITFVDGRPAEDILTILTAVADNAQPLRIDHLIDRSDANGRVAFEIRPEIHHKTVRLTLETYDPRFQNNQAKKTFEQHAYVSPSNAYIAISGISRMRLKPGDIYAGHIYVEPDDLQNIYYMVVARGKIVEMSKLRPGRFKRQRVEIKITHDMVPEFRVVVFTHHNNELIADSLKVDVERVCNPSAQVTIDPEFSEKEPGRNGKLIIRGTKDTSVGLLAVDEAVYALSKKDLLTKTKLFNKLASHDLGCGPGGGANVNAVLGNAGIALVTNNYTSLPSQSCVEIKRRKREITKEIEGEGIIRKRALGIYDLNVPEFIDPDLEEEFERQTIVRSDLRETWIYENIIVGPDTREEVFFSLPHSITTWVVQAVSVSPSQGICVSQPQKLVSFQKLFLHLNLPYSVVRNDQVEIQATVFNYGNKQVGAIVYMYGVRGLCSGTPPGEKSERKRLIVDAQSAASVTFPVVPLDVGHFDIRVVVLSPVGSDAIRKQLYVVPEGVTKEIHIPITLDPTNQQRRNKWYNVTPFYSDYINVSQNLQTTIVDLAAPERFITGNDSCSITALGDRFGPAVETAIPNPESLLRMPYGNGESNMMLVAPTLYTMRYMLASGRMTEDSVAAGFDFIRRGYDNVLAFRKEDGSYAAFQSRPTSTWLTAFVMKVFCQASTWGDDINQDFQDVICSGVRWLINNQEQDGSFIEKHPVIVPSMMGGVQGSIPMTAFALIALEECKCNTTGLELAKTRAVAYLETHLDGVIKPLPVAIVAYALALSGSQMKHAAYDKLLQLADYDEDNNWMYWTTDNSTQDIETAGYGLLTHLLFKDMRRSRAIVNWLNGKQLQSGIFKSTQDTVIALQSLSEYAIRAHMPFINLVSNISSSNDQNLHKVIRFYEDSALVPQDVKIDKCGGRIFINTTGQGMGSMTVKLRYNVIEQDVCKFNVTVNVTSAENVNENRNGVNLNPGGRTVLDPFPEDLSRKEKPDSRVRRQGQDGNYDVKLQISLCVRYLGNNEAGMSIVDVGVFSGFEPVIEDLEKLERDETHLIDKFEKSSMGVVFYLNKVPIAEHYCFSFHVIRQYIVENTLTRAIKVYDYYKPDATCTKFYSPGSNSRMIRTICENDICDCAEGGCPPKRPFSELEDLPSSEKREMLMTIFCHKYDYVWKVKLSEPIRQSGGLMNMTVTVEEVVKEGIEQEVDIEAETRTLLAPDNCRTAHFLPEVTYLVLGKDGKAYKTENDEIRYFYLLDQTSVVYRWTTTKQAKDRQLQRHLNYVVKKVKEKECDL